MLTSPQGMIRKRRAEIAAEIVARNEAHAAAIANLKAESLELDTAERVLTRFAFVGFAEEAGQGLADKVREESSRDAAIQKPFNIPTMPEMILAAIRDDEAGLIGAGLEPREILKFIAKKWWPDVRPELVGPIAWRMWKQGRLSKNGSSYRLPKENDPAQSKSGQAAEQGHEVDTPAKGREAGPGGGI